MRAASTLFHEPAAGTEALFRKWNRPFRDGHHSGLGRAGGTTLNVVENSIRGKMTCAD